MVKAIIFDMDGVIVDTEPLNQKGVMEYVQQYNPNVSEKEMQAVVGTGVKDTWSIITELSKSGKSWQEMKDEFENDWKPRFQNRYDYKKLFRPEIKEVILYAKQNQIKTAVASSTQYKKVKAILQIVGIFELMNNVISGEDCKNPKPYPDVYLRTAEKLGVRPEDCIVIEDSSVGIKAAHEAGAIVLALIDRRFDFDTRTADYKIETIREAISFLGDPRRN